MKMETTPTKSPKPKAKAKPKSKRGRPAAGAATNGAAPSTALVKTDATAADPGKRVRKPPVRYSEEIAEIILKRLAPGETLRAICSTPGLPDESTVRYWARDPKHPFAAPYEQSRMVGYFSMGRDHRHCGY
jgi:hypothetical protein